MKQDILINDKDKIVLVFEINNDKKIDSLLALGKDTILDFAAVHVPPQDPQKQGQFLSYTNHRTTDLRWSFESLTEFYQV